MARPSKLTEKQWAEVEKRLLAGEKPAALAKEFKIDRAAITRRFSQHVRSVKQVANQIVETEAALRALPVAQQVQAISLADELRVISTHLAGAARFSSMTSHRVSMLANQKAEEIDETASLEENAEAIKSVAAMQRLANEASTIPLNLLNANKDMIRDANSGKGQSQTEFLRDLVQHLPD